MATKKSDIAVIGMAGRFPGAANVPELWKNLVDGKDCVTWLTDEALQQAGVAKADYEKKDYVRAAYLLDGYDTFDAEFFNVAPVDAEMMDPQIRLILQCAWNALEDGGYASSSPKNIGVFAGMGGVTTNYLASFINRYGNIEKITASKTHTGNDKDFVANFISYKLNLTGPSIAVQTACSTSLVAVHQACSALLNDECEMCLAGGVNIRVPHARGYEYKRGYIFSKSGKIRSFDAAADGVVFGNGVGLVLLKSLDKAIRDGDNIYAVVKGTAVTNDGKDKVSYTATSVNGQALCIERALRNAAVDPATLGFVESHGTGTLMGDPMEIGALAQAFAAVQSPKKKGADPHQCALGALKTSIGHLDVAAGITGFIKTVLALRHGRIPPTLHFHEPNPRINFAETPFYINNAVVDWPANGTPRRAGVNSVGVGGTNAFAVLEEYVSKPRKTKAGAEPRSQSAIVPLSARSPESLRRHAAEVARFLDARAGTEPDLDLIDLAYSLQIGREAMACRCAFVSGSIGELRRQLSAFLEGNTDVSGWLAPRTETAASKPEGLAERWVAGETVQWLDLYGAEKPKRISLPGYCFDAKRFWMDPAQLLAAPADAALHPLLQRNVSDWEGPKYLSRFQGTEFFLAQHLVHGRKVLPGAACLEMARAALASAVPSPTEQVFLRLKNVEWIRPIEVAAAAEVQLELAESEGPAGATDIAFRIHRPDQPGELAHSRGEADFLAGEPAPALDPKALMAGAARTVRKKDEIYQAFSEMGIGYGPAFQVLQSLHLGDNQVVARIALPSAFAKGVEDFALHPALLDGAFQACTCLGLEGSVTRKVPPLPFALESLIFYRPCPADMTAWVRRAAGGRGQSGRVQSGRPGDAVAKFDADLMDASGAICVELRGFTFRYPDLKSEVQSVFPRLQTLVPVWNRLPIDRDSGKQSSSSGRLLILHYPGSPAPEGGSTRMALDPTASIEAISDRLRTHEFEQLLWIAPAADATMAAFRLLKALLALGQGGRELKLTLLVDKADTVMRADSGNPGHAGIIGLVGSLAKEYPRWRIRLLDVDFARLPSVSECLALPFSPKGDAFASRNGEWFAPAMAALDSIPSAPPAFRQKGVYVIIGGAGGLGEAWSKHLIEKYQAHLVWIGRSALSPAISAKIQALTREGRGPLYLSADATDEESLRQAYRVLSGIHPVIHGVVHAAIVLDDKSLIQMDEVRFRNGFSAKADVALNMQRVFGSLELDFMLFFSSMQTFYKAPGQSNYAAGCTFQDVLARKLDRSAAYPVKIVNWGFWGNIGVVGNDFYQRKMAEQGVGSIEIGEGMACLEAFMGSGLRQVAAVKALDARAFKDIILDETIAYPASAVSGEAPYPDPVPKEPALGMLAGGLTTTVMDELAAKLLASTLAALGAEAGRVPYLAPWLEASRKALRDRGMAAEPEDVDGLWMQWELSRTAWLRNEELRAHVELLESCLRALPEVLTGARPATQVLFPESSLKRVQGVYSGNPVSDYYNDLMADVLAARVETELRWDPRRKFRILEIGAGTGGTTARILPKLRPFAASLAEYRYTDLSKAFLIHAQERFAPDLPSLETALLDIAKPLNAQGIEEGRYDFVLATNVLHATSDARESLRNAKAALKPAGTLILNEISTWSLYSHLTFGLLEGWWLYQDPALRIAGSAAISPETWIDLLAEEGFPGIKTPALEWRDLGQQIFCAQSDGVIRQKGLRQPLVEARRTQAAATPRLQGNAAEAGPHRQWDLRRRCLALLQRLASETLRMDSAKIDPEAPLETYGLDSILILKFTDKLREIFSEVTSTVFFEVQTLGALADHFLREKPEEVKAALSEGSDPEAAPAPLPVPARALQSRRPISALRSPAAAESIAAGAFDIAIVGLNGRYPKSPDVDAFWRNLAAGVDCISEIPRERWNWEEYFDAEKGKPGKIYSKWGGFLEDIDKFDPLFFRISPKEAKRMDPQERLFLEAAYKAIEDAGYTPAGLGKSEKIGVYVGVMNSRYSPQPYYFSIANRVSYLFDFRGPSMAVDTACSSSLTAIHLAAESIANGTCDCAIAGGVNLIIDPVHYQELSDLTMLSAGSRVRSFGSKADGFVDAEGVGAVVLKPLRAAERDKDHIYAVIKGSAINAGGKTNGYTVPNPKAQAEVVAGAIARAGIPAGDLGYLEAHGTGTALGDPIEIAALGNAFRQGREEVTSACRIGSVKSNIGHCESAAGIAGLTKVLLQLKHGKLVPSLHAAEANPEIDFVKTPFALQRGLEDWERIRRNRDGRTIELPRAAGISSFGAGGANAHLIVQEYLGSEAGNRSALDGAFLIPLSARTQDQLRKKAQDLADFLQADAENPSLASIAYTLQVGREAMGERMGCIAADREDLLRLVTVFLAGKGPTPGLSLGQAKANKEFLASFRSNPGAQASLEEAIARRDLTRLLDLWGQGVDVPWARLYEAGSPGRVSLPTYPFARERYWEIRKPHSAAEASGTEKALHPLVHRNTSNLRHLQFTSRFRGAESFTELSAGCWLEMARAAWALVQAGNGDGIELAEIEWAEALLPDGNLDVNIALLPEGGREMAFEIFSAKDGVESIHCQGRGRPLTAGAPQRHVIPASPGTAKDGTQWLRLESPTEDEDASKEILLHPAMLEKVFAAVSEACGAERLASGSLAAVRIYGATAPIAMACIRPAQDDGSDPSRRFDVDLCKADGEVCLRLIGLAFGAESLETFDLEAASPAPLALEPIQPATAPMAVRLDDPQELAAENSASISLSRISLSDLSADPIQPAPASRTLRLADMGDGIFSLTVDVPETLNRLTSDLIAELSAALRSLADKPGKVLILRGNGRDFLRGGAGGPELPLSLDLCRAVAGFPYPIIACMDGDADGAGWLLGALCDFMIADESATYRWTAPDEDAPVFPGLLDFHRERFGSSSSEDFLCLAKGFTGTQTRGLGWSCPVFPKDEVGAAAERMAHELAGKPEKALRLLKQHLGRGIFAAAERFSVEPSVSLQSSASDTAAEIVSAETLRITEPVSSILQVEITDESATCLSLLGSLHALFAQLRGSSRYHALVLSSARPDFFPAPETESAQEALSEAIRMVQECPAPIVAAARGSLGGFAWLLAQLCDGCVHESSGSYRSDALSEAAAAKVFSRSFGTSLGKEILLSGREYAGAELHARCSACIVAEGDAIDLARERAQDWAKRSASLGEWRKHRLADLAVETSEPNVLIDLHQADATLPAQAEPIALASRAVKATAHPEGILLIEMEDREAKNQFTPELIAGISEAFAYLEHNRQYKAVILAGYDAYFASGGTKESLLSIQSGKLRFTDEVISHLPLRCDIPVIAAVQGHAVGGGLSLAEFCDILIVSEEGKLISPYMDYGFTPGAGATLAGPKLLGYDLGRENLLNAQEFEGADLIRRGSALPVFPRKQVVEQAFRLARALAGRDRRILTALKRRFAAEMRAALEETYRLELEMHAQTFVGQSEARDRIGRNFSGQANDNAAATLAASAPLAPTAPASALTQAAVRTAIGEMLAKELHLDPAELEADKPFVDMGLDSIVGVTWVRKINQKYGTALEAVRIYSYPNLEQFGDYVWEEAKRIAPAVPAPVPTPAPSVPVEAKAGPAIAIDLAIPRPKRATTPVKKLVSIRAAADGIVTAAPANRGRSNAIAVIGMSGRFPKAKNLELYWKNIAEGRDCIDEIPSSRWNISEIFQEGSAKPGKTNSKWMGMLEDHDKFDPLFFNISPKEAIAMDPQQRVFLEACWHAIEYAGYNPYHLSGSKCGVFVGCATGDYHQLSREQKLSALGFTGGNCSILAARIAYFLDLLGPCLSIETACSSSLVAIATACDSLLSGASDTALAGGVNIMAGPEIHIKAGQSNMLSAHGKCFTFDSKADGFVPGEGVGVILLKRLRDAERDGDCIYGVIEGWGVNQDGKTNGITAPKAEAQRRLIQEVYEKHGIDPETIQLIEAHGTGTKLGDPIEVAALKDAFRAFTGKRNYCAIGSVKSNIGHTATAAGVAGVLKCLWALKESKLPPTIHFDRLNEHIDLDGSPFFVNTRLQDWRPQSSAPRRAAVSSFGFSGTNCHLVVSEYRSKHARPEAGPKGLEAKDLLFPLSARTQEQLDQAARDLAAFLSGAGASKDLADVAYTLQVGRKPMEFRLGVMASSHADLKTKLEAYLIGKADAETIHSGKAAGKDDGLQLISADADLKETIILKWLQAGKPHKLLELWVRGVEIDWNLLHGARKPKRTALTVYPFARQRYWIETPDAAPASIDVLPTAALHPLLHRNVSDLRQFAFESEFAKELPTAFEQVEMMAAALARITATHASARPLMLKEIRWAGAPKSANLKVELFDKGSEGLGVEIGDDASGLFCQALGTVLPEKALEGRVDLAVLRARLDEVDASVVPGAISLHSGTGEWLVGLRRSEAMRPLEKEMRLDPALLQQALACLGPGMRPAEIDAMEIGARFGKEMFCRVRASESRSGGYDMDVVDIEGRPAARLRGIRSASAPSGSHPLPKIEGLSIANGHTATAAGPEEASTPLELERDLQASLARALYLEQSDVDPDTLFTDLGMDSIIGVEWVDAINKKHGSRLSGTVLYQYPTVRKLAAHMDGDRKPKAPAREQRPVVAVAPIAPAAPASLARVDLKPELIASLTRQLAEALYLEAKDIDRETLFTDLGMDSIIGVEWVTAINKKHGTNLSATALYQHPTINRLAGMVAEELAKREGIPPPAAPVARSENAEIPVTPQLLPQRPLESFRKAAPARLPEAAAPAPLKPQGIAVVGMAGQFPQARDAEAFWRNIRDGKDCISEIPEGRWRNADFYQPGKPAQGKYYSRWMGSMDEVECFDPLFFNISPTEAKSMDPQQRLFLQSCWHAIENAGYSAASLSESRCGVFVGASKGDYLHLSKEHELSSQGFTGGAISILAARASYFLNLLGPCVTIDTACSSALVAIASACDSLNAHTSDLALAGGVFIMSSPEMHIMTSQAGMLSPEGRCLAFDDRANGFVPADGVGMVVLKRLEDAEKDGDNILGVIEGWGVNQDGKTNGITAPNAASQTKLIQDVYDRFAIDAEGIQLVEAHGTGTRLGDPIEIDALKNAFGKYTRKTGYCAVGSVKSNIGHALTAAGMAGVIKVLHALQRKQLPPTIHVSEINRYIELDDSPFYINTTLKEWKAPAGSARRAAVSSFGFSGTNTHLVIAEYAAQPDARAAAPAVPAGGKLAVPLSAKTREQLIQKADDLLKLLEAGEQVPDLASLAYTLQVGRDAMPFRLAVAAGDTEELADGLRAFLGSRKLPDSLWEGKADGADARAAGALPAAAEQQAHEGRPQALLRHWIQGGEIDWNRLYAGRKPRRAPLPGYPFAKQKYWIDKPYAMASASAPEAPALHPLLQRNTSNLERQSYGLTLTGDEPFLKDHCLKLPGSEARKLLPGAAYLEMARAAYAMALPAGTGDRSVALENVVWLTPLFVEGKTEVAIVLYGYSDADDGSAAVAFEITSQGAAGEVLHCKGEASLIEQTAPAMPQALHARMARGEAGQREIYASFEKNGLIYGPSHRCIASLALGEGEALARMEPASESGADYKGYGMPPGLLDGTLQAAIGMLWNEKDRLAAPKVPFSIARLIAFSSCDDASHAWVRKAKRRAGSGSELELDIDLLDGRGRTCVRVEGFAFRAIGSERVTVEDRGNADVTDYETLLDQVMNKRITIEKAAELL